MRAQGAGQAQIRARRALAPVARKLWSIEVSGLDRLPTSGPAILCPNHVSFLDSAFLMLVVSRNISFVGKAEYMDSWKTKFLFPMMGMIPIDAIFTPIKNVIYTVEPFRVGQKTDYERLALDVYTDGTLTAQEAIQEAAAILQDHLMLFVNFEQMRREMEAQEVVEEEAKEAEKSRMRRILFTPVDELELSVRAHNCLKAANIKTLAELVSLNEQDLLKFRNFGRKSLSELADIVRVHGLAFGMNIDKYVQEQKAAESEA